jgi:hypothetical protein
MTTDNDANPSAQSRFLNGSASDVGPATPAPRWCLPDAEPSLEKVNTQYGGGVISYWSRSFAAEDCATDVWIHAEDQVIDGRVMRTAPRIMYWEPPGDGMTAAQARQLAAQLLNAADVLTDLGD